MEDKMLMLKLAIAMSFCLPACIWPSVPHHHPSACSSPSVSLVIFSLPISRSQHNFAPSPSPVIKKKANKKRATKIDVVCWLGTWVVVDKVSLSQTLVNNVCVCVGDGGGGL